MERRLLSLHQIEKNMIEAHAKTNHFYDKYLPYEFHLRMVVAAILKFKEVGEKIVQLYDVLDYGDPTSTFYHPSLKNVVPVKLCFDHFVGGGWSHDGPEDARLTFNDVVSMTSVHYRLSDPLRDPTVAMIARALTSDPSGINREDRMHQGVYDRIKNTPGATYNKLADRIGNVQYGIMTNGSMPKKYKQENPNFIHKLSGTEEYEICSPMVEYLNGLFQQI